jgi:type IV secretion system protein VirB2
MALMHIFVLAAVDLSYPPDQSVLVPAAQWGQNLLLGTFATIIAVVAIATTGLLMLSGRLDVRRGATVIVGCFVLFGAPAFAAGLMFASEQSAAVQSVPEMPTAPSFSPTDQPSQSNFDPYAGAAVPQ